MCHLNPDQDKNQNFYFGARWVRTANKPILISSLREVINPEHLLRDSHGTKAFFRY